MTEVVPFPLKGIRLDIERLLEALLELNRAGEIAGIMVGTIGKDDALDVSLFGPGDGESWKMFAVHANLQLELWRTLLTDPDEDDPDVA